MAVADDLEARRLDRAQRIARGVAAAEQQRPHRAVQAALHRREDPAVCPAVLEEPQLAARAQHPADLTERPGEVRTEHSTSEATAASKASLLTGSASAAPGTTSTGTSACSAARTANCRSVRSGSMATTSDTAAG